MELGNTNDKTEYQIQNMKQNKHVAEHQTQHTNINNLRLTYHRSVNNALDKDGIIHNEATSLQFCVGDKSWTSTGNVHV